MVKRYYFFFFYGITNVRIFLNWHGFGGKSFSQTYTASIVKCKKESGIIRPRVRPGSAIFEL